MPAAIDKMMTTVMQGGELPEVEQIKLVDFLSNVDNDKLGQLCHIALNSLRRLRAEQVLQGEKLKAVLAELEAVRQPPFLPAEVLAVLPNRRLDVYVGGRRQIVASVEELDVTELQAGDEVLISARDMIAVERAIGRAMNGTVMTVVDRGPDETRIVVQGVGDEKHVLTARPELGRTVAAGDRVVVRRESMCAVERLPREKTSPFRLRKPPAVRFKDIGGLDDLITEVKDQVDLFLHHSKLAEEFGISLSGGMLFVGPPGGGKTSVASAIANHLIDSGVPTEFLYIKPGSLRAMYYGESEARVRELFAFARGADGIVVIFLDEVESLGLRGSGVGNHDDRVLAAILAEMDGLDSSSNILLIAATNRLDLCDEALVRHGRLGNAIHRIPRPGRSGTEAILAKHLGERVPLGGGTSVRGLIEAAGAFLFAQSGAGVLATVTYATAAKHEVRARDVVSGALLAGAVRRAKTTAALRRVRGDAKSGVTERDLLDALDEALWTEAEKLRTPRAANRILDVAEGETITRVELVRARPPRTHRYLSAAA